MTEAISINDVNRHYLDKVMNLAEERDVEATEDIFDARGMKLVAKGGRISRGMQERLILHKLRKPLESSITVADGINSDVVVDAARRLTDSIAPVGSMHRAAGNNGTPPLDILKQARFGNAMSLMLTITERGGASALAHSVMVSLVSICLAKKLGLDERAQSTVALAGLLHDIGELYIEPEYLDSKRRLRPHEWRHVVVHPRIGQMLIQELENFPPAVAQAVSEHHERFDGGGYPRQLGGSNISIAGQVVSVAEMISGVFMRQDRPLERAALALKIIPGEHAHELVSAVSSVLRICGEEPGTASQDVALQAVYRNVQSLHGNIEAALAQLGALADSPLVTSRACKDLLARGLQQVLAVRRAFTSTGLDICTHEDIAEFMAHNREIHFEVGVAGKEIQWRLQDVARNLAMHGAALHAQEASLLQPLIAQLDAAG
ncbi:HD-GYP domain-containing protein [Noviherbaspirillum sedimenti]|uniref:HD domain-containing protein n=1 Tax=Noviherbaspirillum sedimenti TaxID=2320865 RepID=A0A3A3G3V4_9BURK|nr:HD domain-containing phosphohydrolase [Noviherbaspirillum sedimenti]RJG01172.1 HD domain-containing protein [Noviherbaspirillum sedimenti]